MASYKVQLIYFRQTGKYLTRAEAIIARDELVDIWSEINELRQLGRLPGIRTGAGRDLIILVGVPDHPKNVPHLVMPPFIDEDDVTPARIPTDEMVPLVRIPLEEMPRTTTRDVVKVDPDEITPVDPPIVDPEPEDK